MMVSEPGDVEASVNSGATRRQVLRAATAGFALAASGLFLPSPGEDAAAREGAAGGRLGGRHGKNRRGRKRRRTHGDKKRDRNGSGKPPGGGLRIAKDILLLVHNDGPNPVSIEFWYDGNPLLENEWHRDRNASNLAAGAETRYQSPTRSAGAWFDTGGFLQTFWVAAFNPLANTPHVSFRWGGEVRDGVGHTGGTVVERASVALAEGEEHIWHVQQRVATIRRERDSDDNKIFTVRLRPTWA